MILALIPARSGSKSITDKNIQSIKGKPMLAYSIEQAKESAYINRIILDTDSAYYAEIGESFGAEVPYQRPEELAQDQSTDLDVFTHALKWWEKNEPEMPEMVIHLRPTYPLRKAEDIDAAISSMRSHPEWDSLRSVSPAPHTPYKMWNLEGDSLKPLLELDGVKDPYNEPRQKLPVVYQQNACIDIVRPDTILKKNSMSGDNIGAYIMNHFYDIDTRADLELTSSAMALEQMPKGDTFVFDIDGVIARLTPGNDYSKAEPLEDNVRLVNKLHAAGNKIILFTARGTMTGIDWYDTTHAQMKKWGVQFDELHLGKPAADYYVDDRMIPISSLSQLLSV